MGIDFVIFMHHYFLHLGHLGALSWTTMKTMASHFCQQCHLRIPYAPIQTKTKDRRHSSWWMNKCSEFIAIIMMRGEGEEGEGEGENEQSLTRLNLVCNRHDDNIQMRLNVDDEKQLIFNLFREQRNDWMLTFSFLRTLINEHDRRTMTTTTTTKSKKWE